MILYKIGVVADVLWYEIPFHAPFVKPGTLVVIPNQIHGIIGIDKSEREAESFSSKDNACIVPTEEGYPKLTPRQKRYKDQGSQTISAAIGSYKSAVSKHSHRLGYEFSWQGRFHDHIIRTKLSYERIKRYIQQNSANWNLDRFNE